MGLPAVAEPVLVVAPAVAVAPVQVVVQAVVYWLQALKDASRDYWKKMTTNSAQPGLIGCPNQDFPLPTKSNRVRPIGRMVPRLELVLLPELARFALSLVPVRTGWMVA